MLESLKKLWQRWSEEGLHVPFVKDQSTGNPSITLFFSYFSFLMLTISLIVLHFNSKVVTATTITALVWVVATILYMIRKLNKAKIDLNDQSIELENEENK